LGFEVLGLSVLDAIGLTIAAAMIAALIARAAGNLRRLSELEQIWERETGRGLVRPLPDFLQPVAERSRALRAG
ncbi:MAG: hypothetical protein QOE69_2527, partial [Thermoleophilaceae bacterium]|nr:hypothetical protein [Thermoleophilaceae bacterium]